MLTRPGYRWTLSVPPNIKNWGEVFCEKCSIRPTFLLRNSTVCKPGKGKRGAIDPAPTGKTRITIRVDDKILAWFRSQVAASAGGSCRTLINNALREHIHQRYLPLEETLRRVVGEALQKISRTE